MCSTAVRCVKYCRAVCNCFVLSALIHLYATWHQTPAQAPSKPRLTILLSLSLSFSPPPNLLFAMSQNKGTGVVAVGEEAAGGGEGEDAEEAAAGGSYQYLLVMPIWSLTFEKVWSLGGVNMQAVMPWRRVCV